MLNIFTARDAELYILDHNTMYFVGRDWNPNAKESEIDYDNLVIPDCGAGYYEEEISDFNLFTGNLKTQFNQKKKYLQRLYYILCNYNCISIF